MDERRGLGAGGLAYIRKRLEGGKTLAKLLLERLDLSRGSVWAYLPANMPETQAQRFDEWNMPPSGRTESPVERIVWRLLSERENAVGVWEDAQVSANGVWVQNHPDEPLACIGDDVYCIVSQRNLTQETFNDAIGSMVAWWGSPAILATPTAKALAPLLEPQPLLTPARLEPLVTSLHMLFFLAYDGLEYICWTADQREAQP
jgi:hypothetical protein